MPRALEEGERDPESRPRFAPADVPCPAFGASRATVRRHLSTRFDGASPAAKETDSTAAQMPPSTRHRRLCRILDGVIHAHGHEFFAVDKQRR